MWSETGDELFVRYLLGELSLPERDQFEDEYFANDAVHEQLLAIECELIDAYLRGELSADDRWQFEEQYLTTPEGRERIARARLVGTYGAPVIRTGVPRFESFAMGPPEHNLRREALVPTEVFQQSGRIHGAQDQNETPARRSWWDRVGDFLGLQSTAVRLVFIATALLVILVPVSLMMRTGHTTSPGPELGSHTRQPGSAFGVLRGGSDGPRLMPAGGSDPW